MTNEEQTYGPDAHTHTCIVSFIFIDFYARPVLILGPFSSRIIEKLSLDHPSKFVQCLPEYMNSDLKTVEKGLQDNIFIDFRRRGSHFECTTLRSKA